MFGWLTGLCSNGNSSDFQSSLSYITYADWGVPSDQKLIYIIQCFQGKHNQIIRAQKAFLQFKTKFQQSQDKNNMAFRLKNLLILDRCTEELVILDTISHYEYNRLFYERNKLQTLLQTQSLQQFISAYYLYIKKKAAIYLEFPVQMFDRKGRKGYLNKITQAQKIFEFIDKSIQIQKIINQTNQALRKVNKSPQLIQQILTYLLKAYLLSYSIIAISLQCLLSKLKMLKNTDLTNLDRLLKYFNKQFTNTFLRFLENNKSIPAFKNFQYTEILKIDQIYITTFQQYYRLKMQDQTNNNSPNKVHVKQGSHQKKDLATSYTVDVNEIYQDQNVLQLPDEAFKNLNIQLKFSFIPRKLHTSNIQKQTKQNNDQNNSFKTYNNYYHEDFIEQQRLKLISLNSQQNMNGSDMVNSTKKSNNLSNQQKNLMYESGNKLKRQVSKEYIFNDVQWQDWQNIYSVPKNSIKQKQNYY